MILLTIKDSAINVLPRTVPVRLEKDGVVSTQHGVKKKIAAESLVFANRFMTENSLSKAFCDRPNIFSIGDCMEPGRIMDAVWGAFKVVSKIET